MNQEAANVPFDHPLRAAWDVGRPTYGVWFTMGGSLAAEAIAGAGVDWVLVDLQHGLIGQADLDQVAPLIAARGAVPLARVAANELALIGRALDCGALGVIVPLIETGDQAARSVAACRYPPDGVRSFGPTRFGLTYGTTALDEMQRVVCIVQVETRLGLDNVSEIASTPGVDCVFVGPNDLGISLGVAPADCHTSPIVQEAIRRILEVCQKVGMPTGIYAGNGQLARAYAEMGFQMLVIGNDLALLTEGVRKALDAQTRPGSVA